MNQSVPAIEAEWQSQIQKTETATFGMGCFWGPDARFGSLPGVIRTRVGFAGGTTENPTYRKMGDHTETLQIEFNPEIISFQEILSVFWRNHTSTNRVSYKERQYMSLLFYHDEYQQAVIEKVKQELEAERNEQIETEISLYKSFTLAEDRHQKYYLKRFKKAEGLLKTNYPPEEKAFTNSTLAARLNGFVKEFCLLTDIKQEIQNWPIREESRQTLYDILKTIRW